MTQATFEELLQVTRQKDCMMQRTTSGIHRDNVEINLGSLRFELLHAGAKKELSICTEAG
jgi:recombinational DNA repair ATPase RecF